MDNLRGKLCFKGERGYSTYELAVKNGFVGTEKEWFAQLVTNNTTTKHHNAVSNMKLDKALVVGSQVQTFGYYEANDGGAAIYSIREKTDSDVEDGGSIIFLDNGFVAELVEPDEYKNILKYGARKNTDITSIVNKLLTSFDNVLIPIGNYTISDSIVLSSKKHLKGEGKGTIINFTGKSLFKTIGVNRARVEDMHIQGTKDTTGNSANYTIGIDMYNSESTETTDSEFRNLDLIGFDIGIKAQFAWCNSFYNIRVNSTSRPLILHAQSNHNNFYSCHFLCGDNGEISEFINNDITAFFGCEFANGFQASSFASKIAFYSCYFENIPDNYLMNVGSDNFKTQNNTILFFGCHHTGSSLTNNEFLKIGSSSNINGLIKSDNLKIMTTDINSLKVERPLLKGKPVTYITAHYDKNLSEDADIKRQYDSNSGKITINNNHTGTYLKSSAFETITSGEKVHVELSVKAKTESYLIFHQNPDPSVSGNRKIITIPANEELKKYSIDFEAANDFSYLTLQQFAKNDSELDYIVVSKMADVSEFINRLENSPYYMSTKPTFTPNKPLTVYSTVSNEIWTFNGTNWL